MKSLGTKMIFYPNSNNNFFNEKNKCFFLIRMLYINMHVLTSNLVHPQANTTKNANYSNVFFSGIFIKMLVEVPYSGVFESATIGIQ